MSKTFTLQEINDVMNKLINEAMQLGQMSAIGKNIMEAVYLQLIVRLFMESMKEKEEIKEP